LLPNDFHDVKERYQDERQISHPVSEKMSHYLNARRPLKSLAEMVA
jgi:hypothetical protein